jgi:hypothetical protein
VLLFLLTLPLVTPRIRGADEIEYFAYLRSAVFDHDLDFENEYGWFYARDPEGLAGFKATFLDRREPLTGRPINFGPIGAALLWSPFYLLAHTGVLAARALGASVLADGYSWPYAAAVAYASALYGFLGFLLTHDLLRREGVSEPSASWAVAALWLGTPVLYYLTLAPGFSHAPSLFAVALGLWLWRAAIARDGGSTRDWAAIGAGGGLAALVREQDGLFLLLPGVWLLLEAARRRDAHRLLRHSLASATAAALVFAPQLLTYRVLNGRFAPSTLVARKMDWSSPHFLQVLFDPGHGLYLWAPLLLPATLGLVAAWRRQRELTAFLAAGLLLQVWINGAVASWSQAGAFGSRRFVAATPLFAWGLAALGAWLLPRLGRRAGAALIAVFVWWNLSLMVQFGLRLMDRQRLEWPRVAINQVTEVPRRLGRTAILFFSDREALARESR